MISDRAQKGLDIPSLSSVLNKLHVEDPYNSENNKEVKFCFFLFYSIKINLIIVF